MKKKIIFFTGAGISQESGIPTFRGADDSLWSKYDVEIVASKQGLKTYFQDVLNFHNDGIKMMENCEPNYCHEQIAELEKDYDVTVITTNIDDLHEKAGSTNVIHVHGNIFEACDLDKYHPYENKEPIKIGDLHPESGKQLRHNTVLFGEDLPLDLMSLYKDVVQKADHLVIIGSSLQVYPSAYITQYNKNIIYLNPDLPEDRYYGHWKVIQKSACEGIDEVINYIK